MKMKMKIAIVGCGMIADAHVNEIRKIIDTELVAVCDKEPLMASQLADRYDIPMQFTDFDKLLTQCHPDIVHVLTPPATHYALGISALEAGCHVLMEKPFTVTGKEAQLLIDKATSLNKKIMVNHFHNFSPPNERLKEMVYKGQLGEVLHMEGIYSYNLESPIAGALLNNKNSWFHRLPGNLILNNIDHLIGKFIEFIPDEHPAVFASARQFSEKVKRVKHSIVHDELRVMITGEKVSAFAIFTGNINPFQHEMKVFGTKGTVSINYESRTLVNNSTSSLPGPFGKLAVPFKTGRRYYMEGFKNLFNFGKSDFHFYAGANNLFNQFYQCIRNDSDLPIPYSDILKNTWIREEIFKQININRMY
jgi:predicted dehydrogenase